MHCCSGTLDEAASGMAQICSDYTHVLPEDAANDGFDRDAGYFVETGRASVGASLIKKLA